MKSIFNKVKLVKFWTIAFGVIIFNVVKGNEWQMIYCDFHIGDNKNGTPKRKQLIAKKSYNDCSIYWQDSQPSKHHTTDVVV